MHEILCDNSRRVPNVHLGEKDAHSNDSLTYAYEWLLKEYNTINVYFVGAHGDDTVGCCQG